MEYTLKVGDKCYLLSNRDLTKKQFIMITARGAGKKSLIDKICSTLASEWVAAGLIQKSPICLRVPIQSLLCILAWF